MASLLTITRIEWAPLTGERPRLAGSNARLGVHGKSVTCPIVRVTTSDGSQGFGWSRLSREEAEAWIGQPVPQSVETFPFALENALWDRAGKLAGKPVFALADDTWQVSENLPGLAVPCYDTTLYFDDLHLSDDAAAADIIAAEAKEGWERGFRNFKIKVGRGGMHMPVDAGTRRDIAVIRAVRVAVGPEAKILIDANNGYNLNLTKQVLGATADADIFWMEEAFHEDPMLYANLREWMGREGLSVLIADGEGDASPRLLEWAEQGLIDVVQYDVLRPGFTRWWNLGPQLDGWNVRSAPHAYGGVFGVYSAPHLAARIRGFTFAEVDPAEVDGLDGSAYTIRDGQVHVPSLPGFGLALDEAIFQRAITEKGFIAT
ncbi:MAG: mandelate racemase [Chloroflexi bacterium]|nr:MAG: mandelate racemase [Chloroflexota bacterium]